MKQLNAPQLFQELADCDPAEVCKRALSQWDATTRAYTLTLWDDVYRIFPHTARIERLTGNHAEPHEYFAVFIVNYLLHVQDVPWLNEWISVNDIPGGPTFFRGPHEIPTKLISHKFPDDCEPFAVLCQKLGGVPLAMADKAFMFTISPRIPVAVLFWQGDEDFAAEARIMFDKAILTSFALDTIFALAVDVCNKIHLS